jgi:ketosteroid isomerase-like protein
MTQSTDIHTAIADINNLLQEYVKNGNADGMVALDTQEVQVFPRNGNSVICQETIRSFWKSVMVMGIREAREIIETESRGDTTIEDSKDKLSSTMTKMDFQLKHEAPRI